MFQLAVSFFIFLLSQTTFSSPAFEIVPLGVYGGMKDGNLSAYLLKPQMSENYVALDGGTLINGLEVAVEKLSVHNKNVEELLHNIPAYLISHAHLDHLMGLLMAQPELREQQSIMAREETLQALEKNIFVWSVWGNFGDKGEIPHLNFQHYQTLPLQEWVEIPNTNLQVKTFPLSHGGMASSAFLVRSHNDYVLYFGDTGPDSVEKSTNLEAIWQAVAPLARNKQLHAIMLECSFLNAQPNDKLFGHFKPSLYMAELRKLASIVNPHDIKNAIKGLPVLVTHIKPRLVDYANAKDDTDKQIMYELSQDNDIGVQLIRPEQGVLLNL